LDKEEEKLLRQLEVLRRFVKNVEEEQTIKIGRRTVQNYLAELKALGLVDYDKEVHLDIDDIYRTDPYDRLVCVIYLPYNSTHLKNINKALLEESVAEVDDYPNEFDPSTWSLYCPIEAIPEFPSFLILPLFMIATLLAVILCRRKHSM